MTATPYERGKIDGQWTDEQVAECGFSTRAECLAHQERVYQDEMDTLSDLYATNPAYAARHAEYMEGLIAGERESLRCP